MNAKAIPLDPWGTPFLYLKLDTKAYVTMSLGANGAPGGDGEDADIRSDEITNEMAQ
jgi:general secretion pathway protein G